MIELTRIDDSRTLMNEKYIESIMAIPDTLITLVNGKCYAVKESIETITQRIKEYNDQLYKK